mgnify:CR=1 FL=1
MVAAAPRIPLPSSLPRALRLLDAQGVHQIAAEQLDDGVAFVGIAGEAEAEDVVDAVKDKVDRALHRD